jgi:putative tryptophan/tyrosine transport system substrate-binding protein
MRRREFLGGLGGAAAAWPLAARAQQPAMPVIGYLHSASPEPYSSMMAAFRPGTVQAAYPGHHAQGQGRQHYGDNGRVAPCLAEAGYVDGQNVTIDYRWAEGQFDRLPALAAELVAHRPAVLVAGAGFARLSGWQAVGNWVASAANFPASPVTRRHYPDNEQTIATRNLSRKMARSQAKR